MRYRYVQIAQAEDGYGYIVADSYLSDVVLQDNLKLVEDDFSAANKRWNDKTSAWEEFSPEPIPEPQLTKTEQAILETAVNVDYLVCLQEMEF